MQEVFRCVAGSRLFGTANENSDWDYKAVYIPDARTLLLEGGVKAVQTSTGDAKSKNDETDVDMTSFSMQKYVGLLNKMETNAVEMLFSPNMLDESGEEHVAWPFRMLHENRFKVLCDKKAPFLGFAHAQAMRYAVRGERLQVLDALCTLLRGLDPKRPVIEQVSVIELTKTGATVYAKRQPYARGLRGFRMIDFVEVYGRECAVTVKAKEMLDIYEKPLLQAGKRSKASMEGGTDWKGIYHAQRVVDEGLELFSTGELRFPLANASYYRDIRTGTLDLDEVLNRFEGKVQELEELTPIPEFRETPDKEWGDEFIASLHEQVVVDAYHAWRETA
ncbi:tRNA nucleotidyltransferase [Ruegeria phage RpAliso]|nr:tRNA nucleotidyltransferase [Ruegeria phage RpAliso]